MEKMETDESVVDLSVRPLPPELSELRALTASGLTITPAHPPLHQGGRRVLRPRTDQRSYAESPDIVLLPAKPPPPKPSLPKRSYDQPADANKINLMWTGDLSFTREPPKKNDISVLPVSAAAEKMDTDEFSSDNENENEPVLLPLKELSSAEIWERERRLRKLREELRAEETKLVLLKKLRQSQQQVAQPPPSHQQAPQNKDLSVKGPPSGVTVTATAPPPPAHVHRTSTTPHNKQNNVPSSNERSGLQRVLGNMPPSGSAPRSANLPGGATLTPGGYKMQNSQGSGRSGDLPSPTVSITPSVTITPTTVPPSHINKPTEGNASGAAVSISPAHCSDQNSSRREEDSQTPAQRQAAAKLALRKQLEKTLLQIPPPKPPPPEMNFIPNPSNTDFVYLVGLEHVVDFLTIKDKGAGVGAPFSCAQCGTDFTPVWKWEKPPTRKGQSTNATFHNITGKEGRVVCEQCVTSNVKKALKAEHTNRLKTAFVKALQQEQEIEQRLAQVNSPSPTPAVVEPTPQVTIKQATPPLEGPQPPPAYMQSVRAPSVSLAPVAPAAESLVMSAVSSRHQNRSQPSTVHSQSKPAHHQPPPRHSSRHDNHDHRSSQHDIRVQNGRSGGSSGSHISASPTERETSVSLGRSQDSRGHGSGSSSKSREQSSSSSQQQQQQQQQLMAQLAASGLDHHSHAAMQALQHQLFRGLSAASGVNPAALMQFSPLLYPYQLAMAQAAGLTSAAKGGVSMSELQRAAELQRQYLLDLLPQGALPPHGSSRPPWNNN